MSIAQAILKEFEGQVPVTRKFLERLPEDRLTWKPHEKSLSAGQLALHLARTPGGVIRALQNTTAQAPDFANMPQPASRQEVLQAFEESVTTAKSLLSAMDDQKLQETWRLLQGDKELFAMPRQQFIRDVMLNHWYQHRGQFSVYLRILNVPVPASWGPSADEPAPFVQRAQSAA
ncbi:MAG TPA: DinB family protein [Candidatus Acidoferrum sp.]|nr:DinB family protein [Candidatus Acidoferrum sp.]